jgi:hypothetical protein
LLRCWRSGGGKAKKGEGEMTGGLGPAVLVLVVADDPPV